MKTLTPAVVRLVVLSGALGASGLLAYEAGGTAFTKRVETTLLSEPRPTAEAAGKLAYGRKVKIEEVQGSWLRISDGPAAGWVFSGNISETKPNETKSVDALNVLAGKTTATAAARPLTPATNEYATRRKLTDAYEDLNWMFEQCKSYTSEEVEAFLQENKKGEYQ